MSLKQDIAFSTSFYWINENRSVWESSYYLVEGQSCYFNEQTRVLSHKAFSFLSHFPDAKLCSVYYCSGLLFYAFTEMFNNALDFLKCLNRHYLFEHSSLH